MAEIITTQKKANRFGRRSIKLSTKVDLTPMVDLGFLLITFFIFTTSLSEAKAMQLVVPKDAEHEVTRTPASKTITLLLQANNTIKYYYGENKADYYFTGYEAKGLREILRAKQNKIELHGGKRSDIVVIIQPEDASSFGNVVAVLDEMKINEIKKYFLVGSK